MRKLLTCCVLGLVGLWGITAFAYFAWPDSVYVTITRVTTSETRSDDYLPDSDGGWDYGDTTNAITENYGGQPFEFGDPVQIEVLITPPPANDAWDVIALQYVTGTNSGTNAWTTIATRTRDFDDIADVKGCHLSLQWRMAFQPTNYLVRIYAETTNGLVNALTNANNITAKGDGLTWDNHEVVGFVITTNRRPESR